MKVTAFASPNSCFDKNNRNSTYSENVLLPEIQILIGYFYEIFTLPYIFTDS